MALLAIFYAVVAAHAPAEEPERESIDTRVLVVWDDETEATEAEEAKTAAAVEASSPPPPPHTLCVTDAVAAMRRGSLTAVELMEPCHDGSGDGSRGHSSPSGMGWMTSTKVNGSTATSRSGPCLDRS